MQMKIPLRPISRVGPCCFLNVARPHPAKPFHPRHARDAPPVDPIQRTFGYFQRLVQPCHSQIRFIKTDPALPPAGERLFPLPPPDPSRLAAPFPSVIKLLPKSCGKFQKILHREEISPDVAASHSR